MVSIVLHVAITAAEFASGLWTGSLALMASAAHNLGDAASPGIMLDARLVSRRESDTRRTFGYQRAEVDGTVRMIVAGIVPTANLGTAALLQREFSMEHTTLEFEFDPCMGTGRCAFWTCLLDGSAAEGLRAGWRGGSRKSRLQKSPGEPSQRSPVASGRWMTNRAPSA